MILKLGNTSLSFISSFGKTLTSESFTQIGKCLAPSDVRFVSVRYSRGRSKVPVLERRWAHPAIRKLQQEQKERVKTKAAPVVSASSLDKCLDDKPLDMGLNPYEPEKPQCLACHHNIKLDYKNVRLLSQFVSSFSGRVYEKHITGLCDYQQYLLREAIRKSRMSGLMPILMKDPRFLKDPKLFDPMNPQRPNPW